MTEAARETNGQETNGLGAVVWLTIIGGLTVIAVLILAMFAPDAPVVRSLPIYRTFNVPSQSMHPTLMEGDYFFANMNHYRTHEPEYGDLAVFLLRDKATVYVKRVVGKPGDRVQMTDGVLHINGQPVKHEFAGIDKRYRNGALGEVAKFVKETLPNGVSYTALDVTSNSPADNTGVFTLPDGDYFVLGDNLDNSTDSRFAPPYGPGFIQRQQFMGRAAMIYFSSDLSRIGKRLN